MSALMIHATVILGFGIWLDGELGSALRLREICARGHGHAMRACRRLDVRSLDPLALGGRGAGVSRRRLRAWSVPGG